MKRQVWRVWALDVWGNERNGYQINDRSEWGTVALPEDPTLEDAIKALKRTGFLKKGTHTKSFEDPYGNADDFFIEYKGYPVAQLELDYKDEQEDKRE